MNSQQRRENIQEILESTNEPVTASALAKNFSVSRQAIVGDIALMRAHGLSIAATPRGYVMNMAPEYEGITFTIACQHSKNQTLEELYTIVDYGGTIVDVVVEHPAYGEIIGELRISTRYDADNFWDKIKSGEVQPLSKLTEGIHIHRIRCKNEEIKNKIIEALQAKKLLLDEK